ncbi:MAG: DUF4168 domain-containing protein [Elainellaceae cyanobacterium]
MVLTRLFTAPLAHRYGIAAAAIAAVGLWATPTFGPQMLSFAPGRAKAQPAAAVSSEEVQQYARSVLRIEALRTVALGQIEGLIDGDTLQQLACHEGDSVRRLPAQARAYFVSYCTDSIDVVQQNGLSIARFNEITMTQRANAQLANQVQQTLRRLQLDATSSPPSEAAPDSAPAAPELAPQ